MASKQADRFPLLVYQVLARRWQGPAFLLNPGGIALWWAATRGTFLDARYAWAALGITLIGLLLTLYNFLARAAGVRCYNDHLTIRTPLYPIAFAYRRVESVRPVEFAQLFPPEREKELRREFYHDLWGKTAVVIDLKSYPVAIGWLKLWCSPYLLMPKGKGLVLLVDEWMALSRQIEIRRNEWINNRRRLSA
jgi:hypothetical protein